MSDKTPSLFRIFLPVTDAAAARAFYERLLDIKGNEVHPGRVYFQCGPVIISPLETGAPPIGDHVYFSVANIEEVFERARDLNCLEDGNIHDDPAGNIVVRPWRERSFYCRDPWGNGLCFVDETTLFTGRR